MSFKKGQKVSFLDEKLEGIIVEVRSKDHIFIETSDGFIIESDGKNIIIREESLSYETYTHISQTSAETHILSSSPGSFIEKHLKHTSKGKKKSCFLEVDLHLHNLPEKEPLMQPHEKLLYQLDYCKQCLEEARRRKIKKIIFIHGIGTGRLKNEIRQWLSGLTDVEYNDAPYDQYGTGATEVRLYNLHR